MVFGHDSWCGSAVAQKTNITQCSFIFRGMIYFSIIFLGLISSDPYFYTFKTFIFQDFGVQKVLGGKKMHYIILKFVLGSNKTNMERGKQAEGIK